MSKDFDNLHWDDFNVYARSIGEHLDIWEKFYYETVIIEYPNVIGAYTWYLPMPTTECFMLERIVIQGLSSDTLDGSLAIADASTGRMMLDTPLIWWGLRNKRRISVPWMVRRAAWIMFRWNQPISTGFDMFGKPRMKRKIFIMLVGKAGRIIQ